MNIIILNRDYLVGRLTPECSPQIMLISTSDSDYQGPQETAGNDKALRCSISAALPRGPILLPLETPPAAPQNPSCCYQNCAKVCMKLIDPITEK